MERLCLTCKNKFESNNSKKYCSEKCYKEWRRIYRRKWEKNPKRKSYIKNWTKKNINKVHLYYNKYYNNGGKKKKYEYHKKNKDKFIEYRKKWEEKNKEYRKEYQREWNKKHPERNRNKQKKFSKTDKGILSRIKTSEKRRKKNLIRASKKWDEPTIEVIKFIRKRDKKCVYCNSEFNYSNKHHPKYPTYDHLNPNLSLNKYNAVLCCLSCNASKKDKNVLEWLKSKGYKPSRLILKLLNKQN